jgi:hypothetical protein
LASQGLRRIDASPLEFTRCGDCFVSSAVVFQPRDHMPAPFDALAFGLPGHPLELVALILIVDALAMGALAVLDVLQTRREHHAN